MSFQSGKTASKGTKCFSFKIPRHRSASLLIATLMLAPLGATGARAATLLDPKPENSTTQFGSSVAVVGDIDGDGVPDLAVGTPKQDGDFGGSNGFGPPQNVGKVFLVSGANLGVIRELNDPEFQMVNPRKFGGQFGTSVAGVGDINGDGVSDVLVGVPHHNVVTPDEDQINAGRAFLFSGKDGSILLTLDDPASQEGARMGFSVAGLGDVNGDGVADLLVGIPKRDTDAGVADTGAVNVFSGANGDLIRTLDSPTPKANGRFGTAVANAGDVNHDGVTDILIGAPGQSRAFVFNGATGALLLTLKSTASERVPSFGYAVAGGEDLNGDGTVDLAVGAPLQNRYGGAAYVFNGTDGSLQRKLRAAPQAFAKFGSAVALSRDSTGDGQPDLLAGAPDETVNSLQNAGEVFVFDGATGTLSKTIPSAAPKAFAGFGSAITTADFTGDGISETVIGVPFEDADLVEQDGDIVTHLQIGQIEIQ